MALIGHFITVLTSRCGKQPYFEVKNRVKIYWVFSWRNSIHDFGFLPAFGQASTGCFCLLRRVYRILSGIIYYNEAKS
jgi:hypothetical protein